MCLNLQDGRDEVESTQKGNGRENSTIPVNGRGKRNTREMAGGCDKSRMHNIIL